MANKITKQPEIRFKKFNNDWEQRKASDIFVSVSEKNNPDLPVLSASQEKGMILRDTIGIDIKYDKKSLNTYKKVSPGQFVIHLRSFQGGFAYSEIEGITSPAYTVIDFKNKDTSYPIFWRAVLTSTTFIKKLETITYGIRDGRSISFTDFSSLKFHIPKYNEQKKIGDFLTVLDDTVALQRIKGEIPPETGPDEIELDVEYELSSIKTDKINYEYILMLIQSFVPSGDDEIQLVHTMNDKTMQEVEKYLEDLARTNQTMANIVKGIWQDLQDNPENYRDKVISMEVEAVIEQTEQQFVEEVSKEWYVEEDKLAYYVDNYKHGKEHQLGASDLYKSADYAQYKTTAENPVMKLRYRSELFKQINQKIEENILPLREK